jgi:predicted DCC family thiol-disulfide oxidoreductase YuxK
MQQDFSLKSWLPPSGDVIYDGDCGVCTQIVRMLKSLDWFHRLKFYANNAPGTFERFKDLSLERSRQELLVYDQRTGWYGGFQACEWIACRIPLLWLSVPFTLLPGVNYVGDKIYKWTAKRRHKISKLLRLRACAVSSE